MEELIVHSAIVYPQDLEDFIEGIPLEYLEPSNRKIIDALLALVRANRLVNRETLILELGEKFCQSQRFLGVFEADYSLDYANLKEDFRKYLGLKVQRRLADDLIKASLNSEIFDAEFINKYIDIDPGQAGASLAEYIREFAFLPPMLKLSTGVSFFDKILKGALRWPVSCSSQGTLRRVKHCFQCSL
ncbi:hypothetical protein [Helicobacter heilmannii]|uniref:hypothetical protein n=1 Tax=Helicobacter heilmannii TaxID=35817 RepID=UPI002239169E|nr:hypothetical protein [Helicobacter heilmannii]